MRTVVIDHYDSYTYNLIDWLGSPSTNPAGNEIQIVHFDDDVQMHHLMENPPDSLVLSPGPRSPADAPQTLALIEQSLGKVPILGVCLGHQMLGQIAGAKVVRSRYPRHGAVRHLVVDPMGGLPQKLNGLAVGAYNSLTLTDGPWDDGWKVTARCEHGEVQSILFDRQGQSKAMGWQFHPESFLTDHTGVFHALWQNIQAQ